MSSAIFSILVNGAPTSTFQASTGLWEGDPLSPFPFILMAEGLGRALKAKQDKGTIKGVTPYEGMNV